MSPLSSKFVLLVVLVITLAVTAPTFAAAASNKRNMPPACLRAASKLCLGSSTNAMTCLKKLAEAGDSRVSQACTLALATPATPAPTPEGGRVQTLDRLLTEAKCQYSKTVTSSEAAGAIGVVDVMCTTACCYSPNGNACCTSTSTITVSSSTEYHAFCHGSNAGRC